MHQETKIPMELTEDTTRYGEFIPSFHYWLTPEKQKTTAERLANLKHRPIKRKSR